MAKVLVELQSAAPWVYCVDGRVHSVEGNTVCDVRYKNCRRDGPLLAAAPNLLALCERWASLVSGRANIDRVSVPPELIKDTVREMAKARGE